MRFPRWSMRRMMLVVAGAAALTAGPAALWRRAIRFERLSLVHQQEQKKVLFSDLELYLLSSSINCDPESSSDQKKICAEENDRRRTNGGSLMFFREHHQKLEEKYKYAAAHPWLRVAPDPPPPDTPSSESQKSHRAYLDEMDRRIGFKSAK